MTSSNNETADNSDQEMDEVADAMAKNASAINPQVENESLEKRLDAIELLIEDTGLVRDLQEQVADYVSDIRAELNDLRNFRWWATTSAVIAACGLFGFILCDNLPARMVFKIRGQISIRGFNLVGRR